MGPSCICPKGPPQHTHKGQCEEITEDREGHLSWVGLRYTTANFSKSTKAQNHLKIFCLYVCVCSVFSVTRPRNPEVTPTLPSNPTYHPHLLTPPIITIISVTITVFTIISISNRQMTFTECFLRARRSSVNPPNTRQAEILSPSLSCT